MYGGCAGAINLPLVEDDCLIWPHDKYCRICKEATGLGFRNMV